MSHRHPAPARRRRARLAALAVAVSSVVVPLAVPVPAGAAPAPLLTENGLGIRIDETAYNATVVDDLAAPFEADLETILDAGATSYALFPFSSVAVSSTLDLSVGFVGPGAGGANGTMVLTADVTGLSFHYQVPATWPFSACSIWVDVDPLAIASEAPVTTAALPGNPLVPAAGPSNWATADIDVRSSGTCWTHLIGGGFDWPAFSDLSDPASPASQIDDLFVDLLDEVAERTWDDNVAPMVQSLVDLSGFAVVVDQVRTDDHGLIVTADVDGSAGVVIDGTFTYPVANAIDAGVTSNVNSLLAQRSLGGVPSDIIVSLHPNVTNQFLAALRGHLGSGLGTTTISSAIAAVLVDPALGACYVPGSWTTNLTAQAPPHIAPTGPGGAPEMQLSQMALQVRNPGCNLVDPRVATFSGSVTDIAVASTGSPLGPRGSATTSQWSATRTQADAAAAALSPPADDADLLPWARGALATFLGILVPDHVDLQPGGFPGHGATHCTACGRYPGDQRITETFHL